MSDVAIKAEHLGKKYIIGHQIQREGYTALRDVLMQNARSLWNKTRDLARGKPVIVGDDLEEIWALKDINFEIPRGEVVGIVGRNGAGKSTLLKILSRITEPSAGRVSIHGRVASLLEVGTGFHPELTGRENIYLNGSILGMARAEIKNKFDAIVDFAGVEKFLDTPVKRYSSGMYVRLAFAVASHLEPEILIIDEVLAVGDMEFQKKCLGRMNDISSSGRTVLFVSHNLQMVSSLCTTCMLLDNGRLVDHDGTAKIMALYHETAFQNKAAVDPKGSPKAGNSNVQFIGAWASNERDEALSESSIFEPLKLHMSYRIVKDLPVPVLPFFHVLDSKGDYVFLTSPHDWKLDSQTKKGEYTATCELPPHFLNSGVYSVTVQVNTVDVGHHLEFFEHHAISFVVMDNIHENPHRTHTKFYYEIPGVVRPLLNWHLHQKPENQEIRENL